MTHSSITIQITPESQPSTPSWMGEITLMTHHLQRQGVFAAIEEQIHFARRRFGHYEVIDFGAVLFGYVSTAKNQQRPSKRGGSVPSIGPSLPLHRSHSGVLKD